MKITKRAGAASAALLICLVCVMVFSGCGSRFDASGYVLGVLDVTFQDETANALQTMKDVTEEELHSQHQERVQQFVDDNITNELQMNEIKEAQFATLCEKIFASMKYSVGEAEKTGRGQYQVPVEITPSDVMVRFREALIKDAEKIAANLEAGNYKGTDEEISRQVLNDIINHAYELLDVSYSNMKFGGSQTVILTIEAGKDKEYSINDEDMDNLIIKILRLDEIQG